MAPPVVVEHPSDTRDDAVLEALSGKLDQVLRSQSQMANSIFQLMEKQQSMERSLALVDRKVSTLTSMAMLQGDKHIRRQDSRDFMLNSLGSQQVEAGYETMEDLRLPGVGPPRPIQQSTGSDESAERSTGLMGMTAMEGRPTNTTVFMDDAPDGLAPSRAKRTPRFEHLPDLELSDRTFSDAGGGDADPLRGADELADRDHLPAPPVPAMKPQVVKPEAVEQPQQMAPRASPPLLPGAIVHPGDGEEAADDGTGEVQIAAAEMYPQRPRSGSFHRHRRLNGNAFVSNPLPDSDRAERSEMLYLNRDMLNLLTQGSLGHASFPV